MKKLFPTITLLAILLQGTVIAAGDIRIAEVPLNHVYAPNGFDDNDMVEVIVEGTLPNLCFQSPTIEAKLEGNKIVLTAKAFFKGSVMSYCTPIMVPYIEKVKLGVLNNGQYHFNVNKVDIPSQLLSLHIDRATSIERDDFIYAKVESTQKIKGTEQILLKGTNPTNCLELEEIKFISNNEDTYSVLPIMKKIDGVDCTETPTPFEYTATIPTELKKDRLLIHVRSMAGKSVNTILEK